VGKAHGGASTHTRIGTPEYLNWGPTKKGGIARKDTIGRSHLRENANFSQATRKSAPAHKMGRWKTQHAFHGTRRTAHNNWEKEGKIACCIKTLEILIRKGDNIVCAWSGNKEDLKVGGSLGKKEREGGEAEKGKGRGQ